MGLFRRKKKEEQHCPNCGKPVAHGSAFCDSCGLRVSPPPACKKCNLPLAPGTNFCESCGTPVGTTPEFSVPDDAPPTTYHQKGKSSKSRKAKKKALKKDEFVHPAMLEPELAGRETAAADPGTMDKMVEDSDTIHNAILPAVPEPRTACRPVPRPKTMHVIAGIVIIGIVVAYAIITGHVHIPAFPNPQYGVTPVDPIPSAPIPGISASITATPGPEETTGEALLVPGPTQVPPESYLIWLQEERNPITNRVTVIFNGGKGQRAVREVLVRLYRSDGQVMEQAFRPLTIGEGASLQGTKFTDRVEVIITYNNGDSYTVIDRVFTYRLRN
ncbi:MAG: zinc ribbon domain-containing protein [Methanoregula sp.]|jgi:uncharacterized Zn finger protein (UPF0148 family)|nr:zinc ribbon domain-containing protein [Methanoregula sp.]